MDKIYTLSLVISVFCALVACGDDGGGSKTPAQTPDVVEDTGEDIVEDVSVDTDPSDTPDVIEEPVDPNNPGLRLTPVQEGVDSNGVPFEGRPSEGEARIGVLAGDARVFEGIQSECAVGDFVLANTRTKFCVEGPTTSGALFFSGGHLIDLETWDDRGAEGRDRFDIMGVYMDALTASTESIEVVRDGTQGGPAVLRVTGRQEPVMYLAGLVGPIFFTPRDLSVTTEYRVYPDRSSIEVVTWVTNNEERDVTGITIGDLVFWGDTVEFVYPGFGQEPPPQSQGVLVAGEGVSYGWFTDQVLQPVSIPGVDLPATPLVRAPETLPAKGQVVTRRHLAVAPSMDLVLNEVEERVPDHPWFAQALRPVRVSVSRDRGTMAGATFRIFEENDEGGAHWYTAVSDSSGQFTALLRPDRTHRIEVETVDGFRAQGVLEASDSLFELQIIAGGDVSISVDAEGSPSPAKVLFIGQEGQGERLVFVKRGEHALHLPSGAWSWTASRGMEFSAASGEITVADGEAVAVEATLERVIDTPGYIAGEFHQHQSPSLDSEVSLEDRVLSNLVEGVDFAVSSDHDVVTDFGPVIEALGISDLIATMSGVEVSPLYGHFGVYPMEYSPNANARGGLPLSFKNEDGSVGWYPDGATIFTAMREELGARLIQSNHPRGSTGYFNAFRWDWKKLPSEANTGFSLDFDTVELVNGKRLTDTETILKDWYTLLNLGYTIVAVGNSDTHTRKDEPGYPRNYIAAPDVSAPQDITDDIIIDGLLSGNVIISGGAYLTFASENGDVRPGAILSEDEVTFTLSVLSPAWSNVNRLRIVRNGLVVDRMEIGGGIDDLIDFEGEVTFSAQGEDSWFHIIACGTEAMDRVHRGARPFAISNPIYLDADGDGVFTPPGLIDLGEEPEPFCE